MWIGMYRYSERGIDMEYQKATAILTNLLDKDSLDAEEKEAVFTAIGVLTWASLSKSRIKAMRDKRDRSINGKP
jgi:hypothetical protein